MGQPRRCRQCAGLTCFTFRAFRALETLSDRAVKELDPGECFGEASLMSMQRHSASVIALEDSEVIGISRHSLISLQHEDLALFALLMMNIARELARRLKFTDDVIQHYLRTLNH